MNQIKTDEQRMQDAMKKINRILNEEQCELEPFVLIVQGVLVKKEINIVAKKKKAEQVGELTPIALTEGGNN